MPQIIFDSEFLKAKVNVEHGDLIRFMDAGFQQEDGRWILKVAVLDKETKMAKTEKAKKFSLNKANFKAISAQYGDNSDNWVGKEMEVMIIKTQNPQGELVDAVRLIKPE